MPIYEYECGKCRYRFELRQGFDDEPQAECPQCQGGARRVFYPSPIIFKGSGFYITDHRKDGGKESGADKKISREDKKVSETGKSQPESSGMK